MLSEPQSHIQPPGIPHADPPENHPCRTRTGRKTSRRKGDEIRDPAFRRTEGPAVRYDGRAALPGRTDPPVRREMKSSCRRRSFSYAVMAGPDLSPPAVRTRFSDALTARMTASLTTSAAREPTRSRSARVLFLPGTVIMIPDAPGFSNRTQVATDTRILYI